MKQKNRANNGLEELGTESVGHLLWKYIIPAIVGLLTYSLYNIVDRIFIGQFQGQIGLSALTIVYPALMIYFSSALLIGGGGSALISIRLGENNEKEASKVLGNAITMGVFISVAISVFGLLFAKETLLLLGANDEMLIIFSISIFLIVPVALHPDLFVIIFTSDIEVLTVSSKELRYFMFGLPFFGVYFCGTRYFQSIEKAGLANLLSFCKPFVFFIPVLYISAWAWGLDGIWLAEPVSLFLGSLLVSVFYLYPFSQKTADPPHKYINT